MELKNKGTYSIVYVQKKQKYCIAYNINEAQLILPSEKYHFDFYVAAQEYLDKNIEELDAYVTELKAAALKRKQEQEAERLRQEEERKKKEAEGTVEEEPVEEEVVEEQEEEKKENKTSNFWYGFRRFIAGFLAAVIALVGGHYAAKEIAKNKNNNNNPGTSQTTPGTTNPTNPTTPTIDYTLTNEVYEELVANLSKIYTDKGVSASTEDLLKFVTIANINRLVEENPELAQELFKDQTISEYISDAAKIIGMTYGYNYRIYEKENSTANFIRISEAFNGETKEQVLAIEAYIDRFHEVKDDEKATNELAVEFYDALTNPNSDLSYLDHGVGFVVQTYVELITDHIAKNTMSQENRDLFKAFSTSQKFIKGIRSKIGEMQIQAATCANVNVPTYELKLKAMSAKTRTRRM